MYIEKITTANCPAFSSKIIVQMNTSTVFRIATATMGLNGIMALSATDNFFSMAGMDVTADMVTLGQFMGVTFLFFALVCGGACCEFNISSNVGLCNSGESASF
jgi:hypothetical protein